MFKQRAETLIVANHPPAVYLVPHLLRLLGKDNTVFFSIPFYKFVLQTVPFLNAEVIAVNPNNNNRSVINTKIEQLVLSSADLFGKRPKLATDPVSQASAVLNEGTGSNLIICPAGKVFQNVPEKWFSGVGRILLGANNPNVHIMFVHIKSPFRARFSDQIPVKDTSLLDYNPEIFAEKTAGRQVTDNIKLLYNQILKTNI